MMSFAYDVIDPFDLIWIPTQYGSISDSNAKKCNPLYPYPIDLGKTPIIQPKSISAIQFH